MSRIIRCAKKGKDLEGLEKPPYPGEIGQKIYDQISKEAWEEWIEYKTKVINEYKLKLFEPKAQEVLMKHAEEFFFGKPPEMPS